MSLQKLLNKSDEEWKDVEDHQVKLMMFINGSDFVKASAAIQNSAYTKQNPVYYHLICQGIEILIKLLLWQKLDISPDSSKKLYGHKFKKLCEAAAEKQIISTFDKETVAELDWWYSQHLLRYPAFLGMFSIRPELTSLDGLNSLADEVMQLAKQADDLERKSNGNLVR